MNKESSKLDFLEFNKWILSMQVANVYFDNIFKGLLRHYAEASESEYNVNYEIVCKKYMNDSKKQAKELKKLSSDYRKEVRDTAKNLLDLKRKMSGLSKQLANINSRQQKMALDLMLKYINDNIKI